MFDHLSTEKPPTIDIRDWKEKGEELKTAITNAVKETQSVIIRALPDKLIMTEDQYNDLSGAPEMLPMHDANGKSTQQFFLYRTEHNVMEIEVKDA